MTMIFIVYFSQPFNRTTVHEAAFPAPRVPLNSPLCPTKYNIPITFTAKN